MFPVTGTMGKRCPEAERDGEVCDLTANECCQRVSLEMTLSIKTPNVPSFFHPVTNLSPVRKA